MAGVTLAQQLQGHAQVSLFEKSRGYGGRLSVRRQNNWQFDHGAQFFTARSPEFQQQVATLLEAGVIAQWEPKIVTLTPNEKPFKRARYEPHYVAVPGMSNVVKQLASALDVNLETKVHAIHRYRKGWLLQNEEGQALGEFDLVVTALPAPQSAEIMPPQFTGHDLLANVQYSPCFALMLGFDQPLDLNFSAAVVRESPLAWIAVENSRPGRPAMSSLVLHSDNKWAADQFEQPDIESHLLTAIAELEGIEIPAPAHVAIHRWRYARVENENTPGVLWDEEQGLAACGDWTHGRRVEDAFLSGLSLGKQIKAFLATRV